MYCICIYKCIHTHTRITSVFSLYTLYKLAFVLLHVLLHLSANHKNKKLYLT